MDSASEPPVPALPVSPVAVAPTAQKCDHGKKSPAAYLVIPTTDTAPKRKNLWELGRTRGNSSTAASTPYAEADIRYPGLGSSADPQQQEYVEAAMEQYRERQLLQASEFNELEVLSYIDWEQGEQEKSTTPISMPSSDSASEAPVPALPVAPVAVAPTAQKYDYGMKWPATQPKNRRTEGMHARATVDPKAAAAPYTRFPQSDKPPQDRDCQSSVRLPSATPEQLEALRKAIQDAENMKLNLASSELEIIDIS